MVCSMTIDYKSLVDFILQTPAPIYSAAKLSRHYRIESSREKERGRDLVAVSKVCSNVAVELLSLACADSPEALLTAVDDRDIPFLDFLIENRAERLRLTDPHDRAGLGWIPLIVLFLSMIGIFLHLVANAFDKEQRINLIYTRNQFLAIGMMLCFAQLLDFLSFHHLFGPWGVIIRDLMYDLVRFLVILLIFMLGFTAHLTAVYRPMYGEDTEEHNIQPATFHFFFCFELLFFSLFGLTEMDSLRPKDKHPSATHVIAKATFGIYNVITIIVLINLLIAMMSDTYQRIQRQSDTEWKFGRAKLIRNMKRSTTTPSPLNLITKLISYLRILYKTKFRCCRADIIDILRTDEQVPENISFNLNALYSENHVNSWMPNGSVRHRDSLARIPRIEEVLDWKLLVKKFIDIQGGAAEHINEVIRPSRNKQPEYSTSNVASRRPRPASVLGLGRPH
ncbi:hypothetical protein QZH41_017115, partial [Actinostola sp. cb2023]